MQYSRRKFSKYAGLAALSSFACLHYSGNGNRTHLVRRGDTLSQIAQRYRTSTSKLRRANRLSGDRIRTGQKLNIPASARTTAALPSQGETYTVQSGDTLLGIAHKHQVRLSGLKKINGLKDDRILVGQKLLIPSIISTAHRPDAVRARSDQVAIRTNHWKSIIVHHSATKNGNAEIYDRAHRRRGMENGLAYHFVIGNGIDSGEGEIEIGPRWQKQLPGGHVKDSRINLTGIGICLVGNFEITRPSRRQLLAFTQLMDRLLGEVTPRVNHFAGHRDIRGEQTVCPGKNFPLAAMHARYG